MDWSSVGDWIKGNAGSGAALVGSLLTGNIPGAVAAGMSLVSGATGTDNPSDALMQLQTNPDAMLKSCCRLDSVALLCFSYKSVNP